MWGMSVIIPDHLLSSPQSKPGLHSEILSQRKKGEKKKEKKGRRGDEEVGRVVWWIKQLPCKYMDRSLDPRDWQRVGHTSTYLYSWCFYREMEAEAQVSPKACQPASLPYAVMSKGPDLDKVEREAVLWLSHTCHTIVILLLWYTYTHIHTSMYI